MRKLLTAWIVLAAIVGAGAPASSQMLGTGIGGGGYGGGGGGGITWTATDAQNQSPAFAAWSFGSVNIGTASSDRIVILNVIANGAQTAPVINGSITMTLAIGDGGNNGTSQWYASVPTGTTMSVIGSGGASTVSIVVGTLHGQSAGASATPSSTYTYGAYAQPQPFPMPLTVPSGGIGVLACAGVVGGTTPTFTWVNTASVSAGDQTANNTTSPGTEISEAHTIATTTSSTTCASTNSLSFQGVGLGSSWAP